MRQYDYANRYYCPPGWCLRAKENPPTQMVGPASAFKECYDPMSQGVSPPTVCNPYYPDPPFESGTCPGGEASSCSSASDEGGGCSWILVLLAIILGAVVVALILSNKKKAK